MSRPIAVSFPVPMAISMAVLPAASSFPVPVIILLPMPPVLLLSAASVIMAYVFPRGVSPFSAVQLPVVPIRIRPSDTCMPVSLLWTRRTGYAADPCQCAGKSLDGQVGGNQLHDTDSH